MRDMGVAGESRRGGERPQRTWEGHGKDMGRSAWPSTCSISAQSGSASHLRYSGSPEHATPESPVSQEHHPLAKGQVQPRGGPVYARAADCAQACTAAATPAVFAMADSGHARLPHNSEVQYYAALR